MEEEKKGKVKSSLHGSIVILDSTLTNFLLSNGILRPEPTTALLGFTFLSLLRARDLGNGIVSVGGVLTSSLGRGTNLSLEVGLARGAGVVVCHLAEGPEGKTGSHGDVGGGGLEVLFGNGGGEGDGDDVELAKEGDEFDAVANNDELDLGEDEAVAAAVLAHGVVDGGEALEVLDVGDVALDAHAGVEVVEGADDADDAGGGVSAKHGGSSGGVVFCVADEGEVHHVGGQSGGDGELEGVRGGYGERRVDLGEVVGLEDGVEVAFALGEAGAEGGLGEERCGNGGGEKVVGAGHVEDHGHVEVCPGADLADVPPEVLELVVAGRVRAEVGRVRGTLDKRRGRVGGCEEGHERRGGGWVGSRLLAEGGLGAGSVVLVHGHGIGVAADLGEGHLAVDGVAVAVELAVEGGAGRRATGTRDLVGVGVSHGGVEESGVLVVGRGIGHAHGGEVSHGHLGESLGVGLAAGMGGGSLSLGDAGGDGLLALRDGGRVVLGSINLLVLRADLGQQKRTRASDGRAGAGRSSHASADRVGGGLYGGNGRVDGGGLGRGAGMARHEGDFEHGG